MCTSGRATNATECSQDRVLVVNFTSSRTKSRFQRAKLDKGQQADWVSVVAGRYIGWWCPNRQHSLQ